MEENKEEFIENENKYIEDKKDIEVINFIENLLKHHNFSFYVKNKINEDLSKIK